jgi:hypothetical protein
MKTATKTMALGEFLNKFGICRIWSVSVGTPGGSELTLNLDDDGDDYCDSAALLEQSELQDGSLIGTVTRDEDGEWRWDADSLQDSNLVDCMGSTVTNLVVWGQ